MAGDWIKWQKGLERKPELLRTARRLKVSLADACLLWMQLWCWADEVTITGTIEGIHEDDVDQIVGRDGFADIGVEVGWLLFDDAGLVLPNYGRHNGKTAKRRVLDAERKRAAREAE